MCLHLYSLATLDLRLIQRKRSEKIPITPTDRQQPALSFPQEVTETHLWDH